jgi:predicted XRE-type DNA-binding protein
MKNEAGYTIGSDNVFADLGLPNAAELLAKTDLAFQISRIIEDRGLTQTEAGDILGIDQPKVSALVRGKVWGHSMERLYRYLNALGRDVEIIVRPKPRGRAEGTLRVLTQKDEVGSASRTSHPGPKSKTMTKKAAAKRLKKGGTTR